MAREFSGFENLGLVQSNKMALGILWLPRCPNAILLFWTEGLRSSTLSVKPGGGFAASHRQWHVSWFHFRWVWWPRTWKVISSRTYTTPSSITCRNIINPLTGSEERWLLQVFFSLVTLAPGQHFPLEGFLADAPCWKKTFLIGQSHRG